MKKTSLLFALLLLLMGVNTAYGQTLKVFRVSGKVELIKDGKASELKVKDVVNTSSVLNVPYEGIIELLDEKNSQRYTIKTPGKGSVMELSKSAGNSVKELTNQYLSYIQNQLQRNTQIVSAQRYTDFATVTRDKAQVKKARPMTAMEKFQAYKDSLMDSYNAYRRQVFNTYSDFVRHAWEEYDVLPAIPHPSEPEVKPVVLSPEEKTNRLAVFNWMKNVVEDGKRVLKVWKKEPKQPTPVTEIHEVLPTPEEMTYQPMPFTFYGTEMSVRLDESKRFNIGQVSPDKIADVLKLLNTKGYDNVIYDCLQLRSKYNLCDWAYLQMLQTMSTQFCGEGTNESVILTGFLFCQSGYKFRFASDGTRLYLLVGSPCVIYDKHAFRIDGLTYYPVDDEIPGRLAICPASLPMEKCIELQMAPKPKFDLAETEERTIKAANLSYFTVKTHVNKNLVDFYSTYPRFDFDYDSPSTCWATYANVPMDSLIREQLYPQFKLLIEGKSDVQAANLIMNWIHYGLTYEFDEDVWGDDRIFFAEETLFYPYCDCEDRSILFTRLIRDLLHLKCALVYYPGHLATAVHFNEDVPGDRFTYEDEDYVVCDPTFIGSDVGMQMPDMDVENARLIILEE